MQARAFSIVVLVLISSLGRADSEGSAEDKDALADTVAAMGALDRAYAAQFSPDGQRLLFRSSETGLPQLYTANLDGSNKQQISSFSDQIRGLAWSPDGQTLAIDLAPDGGLNRQIYLRDLDDNQLRR
ncbi:MAG: hypothetical protein AAGH65_11495, partial [Pseudomonadota bacterium]